MDHYDDDDELIADGQSLRVPLYCMDGIQREIAAGLSRSRARHQPSFASDTADDFLADAEAARQEAYELYDAELQQAWMRDEDRVTERDPQGRETGTYTKRRRKVTRRDRFGRLQAEYEHEPDKDDWKVAGPLADGVDIYDAYDAEISNAWHTNDD